MSTTTEAPAANPHGDLSHALPPALPADPATQTFTVTIYRLPAAAKPTAVPTNDPDAAAWAQQATAPAAPVPPADLAALQEAVRKANAVSRSARASVREYEAVERRQNETRTDTHQAYAAAVFAADGPGGPDCLVVDGPGVVVYLLKRYDYGFGKKHFTVEEFVPRSND